MNINGNITARDLPCPSCAATMVITKPECPACGTEITGVYNLCPVCRLETRIRELVAPFLNARGSLKDVQHIPGVSYPTARLRIEEMFR